MSTWTSSLACLARLARLARLAPVALAAGGLVLTAGCSGAAGSESTSGEDLSADSATTPIGHYVLGTEGSGNDSLWLNEINLHLDGTFDGDFGNGVSNLSGHYFLANGTYSITSTSKGKSLNFTYSYDGQSGTGSYLFSVQAHGLRLKPTDDASEPWFSMDSAAAPVTVTFAADGSAPSVHTAHAGDTLLLRYSAARLRCGGSGATLAAEASLDSPQPSFVASVNEVKGYYDFLVPVGEGKKLDLWFENTNGQGCTFWNSNSSKNFVLDIE